MLAYHGCYCGLPELKIHWSTISPSRFLWAEMFQETVSKAVFVCCSPLTSWDVYQTVDIRQGLQWVCKCVCCTCDLSVCAICSVLHNFKIVHAQFANFWPKPDPDPNSNRNRGPNPNPDLNLNHNLTLILTVTYWMAFWRSQPRIGNHFFQYIMSCLCIR